MMYHENVTYIYIQIYNIIHISLDRIRVDFDSTVLAFYDSTGVED